MLAGEKSNVTMGNLTMGKSMGYLWTILRKAADGGGRYVSAELASSYHTEKIFRPCIR